MFKKIINIFFLISFFTFIFLITKYYFSEQNLIFTNKSRSSYSLTSHKDENNSLNDKSITEDVVVKNDDIKYSKESAILELEEKKKLLELELITQAEYNESKDKLKKFII